MESYIKREKLDKNSEKNKFNIKGVTLISLTVTIIILIILVGVSINLILGKNGIITVAKQAKENVELAKMEEETELNELYLQIENETGTSEGISYDAIAKLAEFKKIIADAITNRGVSTSESDTAEKMAENINSISVSDELSEEIQNLRNEFENLKTQLISLDKIYPVGSIHISTTLSTAVEVSSKFGGTWEQIKDKFLLSAGNTYTAGTTGGEAKHTLTVEEMPSHNHRIGNVSGTPTSNYSTFFTGAEPSYSSNTSNAGGGQAHNNMPPYLTVYVWKRIA